VRDGHWRAGFVAVDEEDQPARIALDLREHGLVAVGRPAGVSGFIA
jgi:hypothetical protein